MGQNCCYIRKWEESCSRAFLDTQVSLAPTPVSPSVRRSVRINFKFSFCQRLWDLTKRRDDIAMAAMVADMELDMVADMASDKKIKWIGMYFDMVADQIS